VCDRASNEHQPPLAIDNPQPANNFLAMNLAGGIKGMRWAQWLGERLGTKFKPSATP